MFLREVANEKMLLLDSTYAGKALWGLYRKFRKRRLPTSASCSFIRAVCLSPSMDCRQPFRSDPCGMSEFSPDRETRKAYLSMLAVDSSLQGTGAANVLFARLREVALERGMRKLSANVVGDNIRAIRYYAKQGLSVVGPGQDGNHVLVSGELDSSGLI